MNSFLKWVGGKKLLRKEIIKRIPKHICYVEPFGGAGWVLFYKDRSPIEVYNDINSNLTDLFKCVKYHHEELQKELFFCLYSRKLFNDFKTQEGLTDIQRAARFYFLIKMSYGGIGELFGTGRMPGGNSGLSIKNMIGFLLQANERLNKVIIENLDFVDCIQKYDGEKTFFYCDPPYLHGHQYKKFTFSKTDHKKLHKILMAIKGRWLLSLDDCKEARDLYKGCKIETVKNIYSILKNKRPIIKELLISK